MEDIEQYKSTTKKNIEDLINSNNLEEAKKIIKEYEELVPYNIETYSIKAVIAMMEGDMDEAETILKEGLNISATNPELLFNLAYIYESRELYSKAYEYYTKAKSNSNDKNFIDNIDSIIGNLQINYNSEAIENSSTSNVKTSIVILTYNKLDYTKLCVDSIRKYTEKGTYEIIIVDNNSTDETRKWLKKQKDIKVILNNENLGFPGGCNVGIKAAEEESDILLLNNDTIVTPNWLNNLKRCLYSDTNIGAVGAVTNNCANYQSIAVDYESIEDMIKFANKYNISDSTKWEQKVRLIGFCMLIKRTVLSKVGLLDEMFFPGNFEDDDISYRIQRAGYKLCLCNDTFIHHFGSTSFRENREKFINLLKTNSKKFLKKWGFNSEENSNVYANIIQNFEPNKSNFNVLHVGCGTGATLLKIKYLFNDANLFGVESNLKTAEFSSSFANVTVGGLDDKLDLPENYFDYILVTNSIEYSNNPKEALKRISKLLKDNGKLFVLIKNSNYYEELVKIIEGNIDFKKNVLCKYYNYKEISELFSDNIFSNIAIEAQVFNTSEEGEKFIDYICNISGKEMKTQYSTKEYLVCCKKSKVVNKEIGYILRRIENSIDIENNLEVLYRFLKDNIDLDVINEVILKDIMKKDEVYNTIALYVYNRADYTMALKLLEYAYKYNPINNDTLYNLAYIIYRAGDKETALKFLDNINTNDSDIVNLKKEILGDKNE